MEELIIEKVVDGGITNIIIPEMQVEVAVDTDNAEALSARSRDKNIEQLEYEAGLTYAREMVWVDGASAIPGIITLPYDDYSEVYTIDDDGHVWLLDPYEDGMERPYYIKENGKTYLYLEHFSGGGGTQASPYIISNTTDLNNVRNGLSAYYEMDTDVDMSSFGAFTPIPSFTGYFDGKGHKIAGLTISIANHAGLFNTITGTTSSRKYVKNLTLENCNIVYTGSTSTYYSGGIAANASYVDFENIHIVGGYVEGYRRTGAILGSGTNGCSLVNCDATGTEIKGRNVNTGGLIGYTYNSTTITDCFVKNPTITANGTAGGFAGEITAATSGGTYIQTIRCYVDGGTMTNVGSTVGGFLGKSDCIGADSCYSNIALSSNTGSYAGGFAGFMTRGAGTMTIDNCYCMGACSGIGSTNSGGFIGYYGTIPINNCYTSITVSDAAPKGFIGYLASAGTISGSYFNSTTVGTTTAGATGPTSKTDAQMQTQATFSGWDFTTKWYMNTYPHLLYEALSVGAGTPGDPYLISTSTQLHAVRSKLSASYQLSADIDMTSWGAFHPIGAGTGATNSTFNGIFDGNGHLIKNLTVCRQDYYYNALFNAVASGAIVKNLGVTDCNITPYGATYYGCAAIVYNLNAGGLVENCFSTGTIGLSGKNYAGGIVGLSSGTIRNCWSSATITGASYVGGLVGYIMATAVTDKCHYVGTITGTASTGGIVGNINGTTVTITDCHWDTEVTGLAVGWGAGTPTLSTGTSGLTTTQMQTQSNFTNWDFSTIWTMNGYPALQMFITTTAGSAILPLVENIRAVTADTATMPMTEAVFEGPGDPTQPRELYTRADLSLLNTYPDDYFILMNDIDMSASNWTAITEFRGNLNGNLHRLTGLRYYNQTPGSVQFALINTNKGTIRNLGIENVNIDMKSNSTGTAIACFAVHNEGVIEKCWVRGGTMKMVSTVFQQGGGYLAAMVAWNEPTGIVRNCFTDITVDALYYSGTYASNIQDGSGMTYWNFGSVQTSYILGACGRTAGTEVKDGIYTGTVTNVYHNDDVLDNYFAVATTSKTAAQLKLQATYVGFDFTDVWSFTVGKYPYFKEQTYGSTNISMLSKVFGRGSSALPMTELIKANDIAMISMEERVVNLSEISMVERVMQPGTPSTVNMLETVKIAGTSILPTVGTVYSPQVTVTSFTGTGTNAGAYDGPKGKLVLFDIDTAASETKYASTFASAATREWIITDPKVTYLIKKMNNFGSAIPNPTLNTIMLINIYDYSSGSEGNLIKQYTFTKLNPTFIDFNVAVYIPEGYTAVKVRVGVANGNVPSTWDTVIVTGFRRSGEPSASTWIETVPYAPDTMMFLMSYTGERLGRLGVQYSVDDGVTWGNYTAGQWMFANPTYDYVKIKFTQPVDGGSVYGQTTLKQIALHCAEKPYSLLGLSEKVIGTGEATVTTQENIQDGERIPIIAVERILRPDSNTINQIERVLGVASATLPQVERILRTESDTLQSTERVLRTDSNSISMVERVPIVDSDTLSMIERLLGTASAVLPLNDRVLSIGTSYRLPLKENVHEYLTGSSVLLGHELIHGTNFNVILSKERVVIEDSNAVSISERIVIDSLSVLSIAERVQSIGSRFIQAVERVIESGSEALPITERLINGGISQIQTVELIQSHDSATVAALEYIADNGADLMAMHELIQTTGSKTIVLKESVIADEADALKVKECVYDVETGTLTINEYVSEETLDLAVRRAIYSKLTGGN